MDQCQPGRGVVSQNRAVLGPNLLNVIGGECPGREFKMPGAYCVYKAQVLEGSGSKKPQQRGRTRQSWPDKLLTLAHCLGWGRWFNLAGESWGAPAPVPAQMGRPGLTATLSRSTWTGASNTSTRGLPLNSVHRGMITYEKVSWIKALYCWGHYEKLQVFKF